MERVGRSEDFTRVAIARGSRVCGRTVRRGEGREARPGMGVNMALVETTRLEGLLEYFIPSREALLCFLYIKRKKKISRQLGEFLTDDRA